MDIIPQVAEAMQEVLTDKSDAAAEETGFIERKRKLTGSQFVQTLVFGWLANPEATYDELSSTAATVGLSITAQAIEQRFNSAAAEMLKEVLDASICQVIDTDQQAIGLLKRFNGVYIADSSWIAFPDELVQIFKGTGGTRGENSSAKIQVRWEITGGLLEHLCLTDGTTNDKSPTLSYNRLPKASLRLADLGYFSIEELTELDRDGGFWLTRLRAGTVIFDKDETRIQIADWLGGRANAVPSLTSPPKAFSKEGFCAEVKIGLKQKLPCRLLGVQL